MLFDGILNKVMKGSPVSKPVEVAVKNPKVVEKVEKPAPMPALTPAPAKQAPAQETTVASETNDSVNKSNEGRQLFTTCVGFLKYLNS